MLIRRAKSSDLDQMERLWRELADWHADLAPEFALAPNAEHFWRENIAPQLEDENVCLLVAEQDGTLVGFMHGSVRENPPIFVERFVGHISDAIVTAPARHHGFGEQLVDAMIEWFRQHGIKVITLGAATQNPVAQSFWHKMGFTDYMTRMRREI